MRVGKGDYVRCFTGEPRNWTIAGSCTRSQTESKGSQVTTLDRQRLTEKAGTRAVAEHYASHLAPVYLWMVGGRDAAIGRGEGEVAAICSKPSQPLTAVDLGAGFGMHAIPLARLGYSVIAIDSSRLLLEVLRTHLDTLPVRAIADDLLSFRKHLQAKVDLIICMGDTLTHLPNTQSVEALLSDVAASLQAGGMFVSTFRDYTVPLVGQRVSAYQKLQLSTEWMTQVLRDLGFSVRVEPGLAGMVRVVATAG
jgi:2-polyprenyl-3-methyl-5-hydroxy-6-metoxy-1,4-benzoquinol methylase